jgi:hypothetical protein
MGHRPDGKSIHANGDAHCGFTLRVAACYSFEKTSCFSTNGRAASKWKPYNLLSALIFHHLATSIAAARM